MARRRLAADSFRNSDWQLDEYERQMGREAAERQQRAALLAQGRCACPRKVLKTEYGYRTVHMQGCSSYKPWMAEYAPVFDPGRNSRAAAFIESSRADD